MCGSLLVVEVCPDASTGWVVSADHKQLNRGSGLDLRLPPLVRSLTGKTLDCYSGRCRSESCRTSSTRMGNAGSFPRKAPPSNSTHVGGAVAAQNPGARLAKQRALNHLDFGHYGVRMPYASKDAQREYQRLWIARRRAEFFDGKSCVKCGAVDDLELDHIDPAEKVSHRIWSWSAARREAEIAKCQILCATCHDAKTLREYPVTSGREFAKHGSASKYQRGCRCRPCTDAKVAQTDSYRRQRYQAETGMLFQLPRRPKRQHRTT